jgi:hypothetical protein
VTMLTTVTTVSENCACAVAGAPGAVEESVTCTVNVETPETVGTPEIVPEPLSDKPVGKAPAAMLQNSVPTPPVACSAAL